MPTKERSNHLNVRLSDQEIAMAHALAEDRDEPMTMILRKMIRDAYVARFGVTPPKKSQK